MVAEPDVDPLTVGVADVLDLLVPSARVLLEVAVDLIDFAEDPV